MIPLMFFSKKGSTRHKLLGKTFVWAGVVFYITSQALPIRNIITLPWFTTESFIVASCVNLIGFSLIMLGVLSFKDSTHHKWRVAMVYALAFASVLLLAMTVFGPRKHHYIMLALLALALVARDLWPRLAAKTGYQLGAPAHVHYMLGGYAYVTLFQAITAPSSMVMYIVTSVLAVLPAIYVMLPKHGLAFAAKRMIPPLLALCLALSYGASLHTRYSNAVVRWCPTEELEASPACQWFALFRVGLN